MQHTQGFPNHRSEGRECFKAPLRLQSKYNPALLERADKLLLHLPTSQALQRSEETRDQRAGLRHECPVGRSCSMPWMLMWKLSLVHTRCAAHFASAQASGCSFAMRNIKLNRSRQHQSCQGHCPVGRQFGMRCLMCSARVSTLIPPVKDAMA